MGPGLWWVSLPPASSINQHYSCWLCTPPSIWVWPQQSTSASLAVAFDSSSPQCWHKTGQDLRHPPTPWPTLHFYFQSSEAPPCSDLRCRAPRTHPQNSYHCDVLNAGFWIRKGITGKDDFMGHLFFTVKRKKKVCSISKYSLADFGIFVGGRNWNCGDKSALNPICD